MQNLILKATCSEHQTQAGHLTLQPHNPPHVHFQGFLELCFP